MVNETDPSSKSNHKKVKESIVINCGFAKRNITPDPLDRFGPLFIAGYEAQNAPVFTKVHDPLFVRTLVLSDNHTKIAFVSIDCVGLLQDFVGRIKDVLKAYDFPPNNVFIFSTHTHAGPDTMGLWGPYLGKSGVNPLYMVYLADEIIQSVKDAEKEIVPAKLMYGHNTLPSLVINYRSEKIIDSQLFILQFHSTDGTKKVLGTLWGFTAQPEMTTRSNTEISADYPGIVNTWLEQTYGGHALFSLGLCGAQTPIYCEQGYSQIEQFGQKIITVLKKEIQQLHPVNPSNLEIRHRTVLLPLQNANFGMLFSLGVLNRNLKDNRIASTVSKVRIGPVHFILLPGEPFPGLLVPIYRKYIQKGEIYWTISLANDALGYFLPASEFRLKGTEWADKIGKKNFIGHELESIGGEASQIIKTTVRDLLQYHVVLAIGPHADDLTIFCGGLLRKFSSEGDHLICVRVTDDYDDALSLSKELAIKQNREEADRAYSMLGAHEIIHLEYPSDSLAGADYLQLREKFVYLIRKYKPTTVVAFDLNGLDEENMDHIIVARAVNEACWQAPFDTLYTHHFTEGLQPHAVAERYLYARHPTVINYQLDITEFMDEKVQAISQHETVMVNSFQQYLLSARANRLFIELLEAPGIPNPIRANLLIKMVNNEIGVKFGAKFGEIYNKIDAGLIKDMAVDEEDEPSNQ